MPRAHPVSWGILTITSLAILMTSVDAGILSAVLPSIQQEFGFTTSELGLVNSVFFAGTLIGALAFGLVSDRIGSGYRRSWTWAVAMTIGVLGGVLTYGMGTSVAAFLVLRGVMGFSRGGSEPTNVALVGEWWPKEHRGFAVGVHHTGFPLGQFATGALVAGVLAFAGWREVFLLVPLIGVPIIIAQLVLGRKRNQQKVFDWIDGNGKTRPTPELSVRASGSALVPFKVALASSNVRWAVLLIFLFEWVETGASTFLTTNLVDLGLSNSRAALIAGATGLTGWIGQIVWGTLSDRSGRKRSLNWLVYGWVIAMAALTLLSGAFTGWLILLFWGLFRNAPFPVVYALLMDSVAKAAGTAMGLVIGVAFGLSGILVGPVAGWIIDTWGYGVHYAVLAVVGLLCLVPIRMLRETAVLVRDDEAAVA